MQSVIFIKNKTRYFYNLEGRVYRFLFLVIENLTYNNNIIEFGYELKNKLLNELKIQPASLTECIRVLKKQGIFKKIKNNSYLYNPHLFYYADESVAKTWQDSWVCDFKEDSFKINILFIKKYF